MNLQSLLHYCTPTLIHHMRGTVTDPNAALTKTVDAVLQQKKDVVTIVTKALENEHFDTSGWGLTKKMLGLVVGGVLTGGLYCIYSIINDIVDMSHAEIDHKECGDLVADILSQLLKEDIDSNAENIVINLADKGKGTYLLEDRNEVLSIIDESDNVVASFDGYKLRDLLDKLKASSSNDNDLGLDEWELTGSSHKNVDQPAEWHNTENKMGWQSMDLYVANLFDMKYQGNFEVEDRTFVFKSGDFHFAVHPTVEGEDEARSFIDKNLNTNHLVLVPYAATNRGVMRENHVVLMAIHNNNVTLIDPKSGDALGDLEHEEKTIALEWQDTLDVENCGYFVYHMIQSVVDGYMGNKLDDQTAVQEYLQTIDKPDLKTIKRNMPNLVSTFEESLKNI